MSLSAHKSLSGLGTQSQYVAPRPVLPRSTGTFGAWRNLRPLGRPSRLAVVQAKRATEEDERLIEEMKRAAEKGDLLEGGAADAFVKVLAVAAAVGFVVVLAYLGQPVIQNTVASFPSAS